jgi:PAS domain S-box-containing protein
MIKKKIRDFLGFVLADDEDLVLQNRLFLSTIIIGIVVSFTGAIISILLSSSLVTIFAAGSLFLLLVIFYYFVRVRHIFNPFVVPAITFSFIGISVIWVFDGGINGSDLFVGFVILILSLIIVPEKNRKYIISLFISLVIIIYLIQYYSPDLITRFPSEKVRWKDGIITAVYTSFFIFLIIRFLLRNYTIEKQRAEENELKFRALSENSQDSISRFDRQHRRIYINQAGIKVLGVSSEFLIGKTPEESGIYNEEQSVIFKNTIEKAFTTKQPQFEQYCIKNGNGSNYYDLRLFPEFNDKNEVVSVLGVSRDITILKESEIKLRQLNADKDLFISILAHDLRNPFNSIMGLSQLLLDDLQKMDPYTVEKYVEVINTTSQKTYNLLEDLLLWTRSQSGKLDFKPRIIDFAKTCEDTIDNMRTTAVSKKITINYSGTGNMTLLADEDMLKVVLRNLISNAIKFTHEEGQINIIAGVKASDLAVTVSDNGVGIASGKINDLFDISKIVSTKGTSNEKGTGLGLLLCREFVEKHGGRIWVESIEGKGSDFKFTLPAY